MFVVLSLLGILSGFVVMLGPLFAKPVDAWTAVFLVATLLISVTGFLFPSKFLPSHGVGIVPLIVLALAIPARYVFHLGVCAAQKFRAGRLRPV